MKAIATHPIEHIRVYLAYEEIRTRLLTSIKSLSKKVYGLTEKIATAAVVILIGLLFVTAFMKLGECSRITTNYCDICDLIPKMISMP